MNNTIKVIKTRRIHRGIFAVLWTDTINTPRKFETLYRLTSEGWASGENSPTGCYSSPLRTAPVIISDALNAFTQNLP